MDGESNKRGRYKKYLSDDSIDLPASTRRFRSKKQCHESSSSGEENEPPSKKISNDDVNLESQGSGGKKIPEVMQDFDNDSSESIFNDSDSCLSEDSCEDYCFDSDDSMNVTENFLDLNLSDEENIVGDHDEEPNENEKLMEDSDITRKQSKLLIMTFALRHKIPDVGLNDFLDVLDCHFPYPIFKSKYQFLKEFPEDIRIEYFVCDNCCTIVTFNNCKLICKNCKSVLDEKSLRNQYKNFFYIPLSKQLTEFIGSIDYTFCRKTCYENDIVNSSIYKNLRTVGVIKDHDISIQWNTDGVSLVKSREMSVWPILVTINELDFRRRKNNMFLCGLHYGPVKPDMNLYLEPFIKELTELYNVGLKCIPYGQHTEITVKVHTLLCTVDSVARPLIQNFKQYNGKHGCSYCLQAGERVQVNTGHARVYRYKQFEQRTAYNHLEHLNKSEEEGKVIFGVKGPSIVSLIPNTDIIKSYPPDYLHSCLLGVAKLFVSEWYDSKNSNKDFYIGLKIKEVNKRLLEIRPPCEVTRTPRELGKKFKANEWKNFVLYYSLVCLKDILPERYLRHWESFVYGLYIFSKITITDTEFERATEAFQFFVKNVEKLYGKQLCKYNVHLLLHIPMFVEMYGSLWSWSTFPYEGFNGVIRVLYHGTQYTAEQMCKTYTRLRYIKNNSNVFGDTECSEHIRKVYLNLINKCKVRNGIEYSEGLKLFGRGKIMELTVIEKNVIESALHEKVELKCEVYARFVNKKILFHSTKLSNRLKKRNNSVIITDDGRILEILFLSLVTLVDTREKKIIVVGTVFYKDNPKSCDFDKYNMRENYYICRKSSDISSCQLSQINSKCIAMNINERLWCVIPIVNTCETD